MPEQRTDPQNASPWAPLGRPLFRSLWIATVASNVGTWMHEVGAGWLMVTLDPSPIMVALVQAANILPVFFLALPAGALADIVDRRRLLIVTQLWMLACALLLSVLTLTGTVGVLSLLAVTFAMGCGAAMMTPAWAATVPELVPRAELQAAVALNSMGINVARAIGPAVAGVLVAAAGPAPAFVLNAVSFLGIVIALARWQRAPRESTLPTERFIGAMRAGMRYVREAPAIKSVILRAAAFFAFANATWALLPLIARDSGGGAGVYGVLLASIGAGAVGGALALPRLRRKWSRDALVRAGTVLYVAAMLSAAYGRALYLLVPAMAATGAAWLAVLSSLHVSAQTSVPAWVRARALSIYLVTFAAATAAGSVFWGAVAGWTSVAAALAAAAAGALVAMAATWRRSLGGETADGMAPVAWPEPQSAGDIELDRGPVLITVEYRVSQPNAAPFAAAMQRLRRVRVRDGAISWGLFEDVADPGRYVESFVVESWAEHLRQHHRSTVADSEVSAEVRALHAGTEPPRVSHMLAVDPL